jgi:hypothetical protein
MRNDPVSYTSDRAQFAHEKLGETFTVALSTMVAIGHSIFRRDWHRVKSQMECMEICLKHLMLDLEKTESAIEEAIESMPTEGGQHE